MPRRRKQRRSLYPRTTQFIYGERHSLVNALRLLRATRTPRRRRLLEEQVLLGLIRLRTLELNAINPDWDRQLRRIASRRTGAAELRRLARKLPPADYYLARLLSDHANAPPDVLRRLANHPYRAVRENVARHPRTPAATLRGLAARKSEPLWYLVVFNPGAPEALRARLRRRLKGRVQRP